MQQVEQFISNFLQERISEEKRYLASRSAFRRKFYADGCFFDSRAGSVEMIESESIVNTHVTDKEAQVITRFKNPQSSDDVWHKHRYRLLPAGDTWVICEVEIACFLCNGSQDNIACVVCQGKGWLSGDPRARVQPPIKQ